jgi:hypothetical protein
MGGFFSKVEQKMNWMATRPGLSAACIQFEEGVAVLPKTRSIVAKHGGRSRSRKRHVSPVQLSGVNDRVFGVRLMTLLLSGSSAVQADRAGAVAVLVRSRSSTGMVKEC